MMKRIIACLLTLACLLTAVAALADGDMKVIKVNVAVNMREKPNTDCAVVAQVPLGTVLSGCQLAEGTNWYAVTYQGVSGYIREDFLESVAAESVPIEQPAPVEEPAPAPVEEPALVPVEQSAPDAAAADDGVFIAIPPVNSLTEASGFADDFIILDQTIGGVRVVARQIFQVNSEYIMVAGLDAEGNQIWMQDTATGNITELNQTECFIGGTAQQPLVMMYSAWAGLKAIDPATGEIVWTVPMEQTNLGAGISYAVAGNGVAYIGGYYGPDPVAIDAAGNVLWQSDSGEANGQWLYAIEPQDSGIIARYYNLSGDKSGYVVYNYDGTLKQVVYE